MKLKIYNLLLDSILQPISTDLSILPDCQLVHQGFQILECAQPSTSLKLNGLREYSPAKDANCKTKSILTYSRGLNSLVKNLGLSL